MDTLPDAEPAPPATSLLQALQLAFQAGVLTKEELESKKAAILGSGTLSLPSFPDLRMRAGKEILSFDKPWRTLESFASFELARLAIKSDKFGRCKWNRAASGKPGDRRFVCNEHVDCARPIRIFFSTDGDHQVQIYDHIAHSSTPNPLRRKNSAMTADAEDRIKKAANKGATHIVAYRLRIHCVSITHRAYHRCDARQAHIHIPCIKSVSCALCAISN